MVCPISFVPLPMLPYLYEDQCWGGVGGGERKEKRTDQIDLKLNVFSVQVF